MVTLASGLRDKPLCICHFAVAR